MALINCPVCGKPVSDRSKGCVYCGSSLTEPVVVCPRCGNKQSKGSESCMMCDCPLNVEMITCPECEYYMPAGSEHCDNCGCPLGDKDASIKTVPAAVSTVATESEKKTEAKEKLKKEKKIFNICSIAALVMSEISLILAIVLPAIHIAEVVDLTAYAIRDLLIDALEYGSIYRDIYYVIDTAYFFAALFVPLVFRLVFVAARRVFEGKARKAERELEKYE